jgi:hypothetical protein
LPCVAPEPHGKEFIAVREAHGKELPHSKGLCKHTAKTRARH